MVRAAPAVPEPASREPDPEPELSSSETPQIAAREYAVPALDKALDILELLADQASGLSQAEIAAATDRSASQIFRVLTTLERRGYLHRDAQSGLYLLSTKLFDLAHRQEPLRSLIAAALPFLRELADETRSSCNLSVLDADRMRVVAQVVSPSDFGFQVRVGALFPVATTASGLVQLAFSDAVGGESTNGEDSRGNGHGGGSGSGNGSGSGPADQPTADALARIAENGYLERTDSMQPGVTDIVFPILNDRGVAVAVLTVPYVATSFSERSSAFVLSRASVAASNISASLMGGWR